MIGFGVDNHGEISYQLQSVYKQDDINREYFSTSGLYLVGKQGVR